MDEPGAKQGSVKGSVILAAAVLAGSAILSWGLASAPPRYELVASGELVVRMDNDSGEMIACGRRGCAQVQPPDRARVLEPIGGLIGAGPAEPGPKQVPEPGAR